MALHYEGKQITQLARLMCRAVFQRTMTSPEEHSIVRLMNQVNITSQTILHVASRETGVYVGAWEAGLLLKTQQILFKSIHILKQ